jgi:hypothetical protein
VIDKVAITSAKVINPAMFDHVLARMFDHVLARTSVWPQQVSLMFSLVI